MEMMEQVRLEGDGGYSYTNPSPIKNIGDPFILKASDGRYYCYATSASDGFLGWKSENLVDWREMGYVFRRPENHWAFECYWAPEVVEYNSKYYMYYTARCKSNNSLRIGVALADSPAGPFEDFHNGPMFDFGYAAIDAHVFIDDDNNKYLYYVKDCSENVVDGRHESHMYGIRLKDDMVSLLDEPVLLTRPEQAWEMDSGPDWLWNEGPFMLKHEGRYYLMFSTNFYASSAYSVGYAVSESPMGPFIKPESNPVLERLLSYGGTETIPLVSGPGHNSVTVSPDGSEMFIVYHTHTWPEKPGADRQMCIDRMGFRKDGTIYVNGPTLSKQPVPSGAWGLTNISRFAKVSRDSTMIGYTQDAINDGEIVIGRIRNDNQWMSHSDSKSSWIKLSWDREYVIESVWIYPGYSEEKLVASGLLQFSDNTDTGRIEISSIPGKPAVFYLNNVKTSFINLVIEKLPEYENNFPISEVIVFGREE